MKKIFVVLILILPLSLISVVFAEDTAKKDGFSIATEQRIEDTQLYARSIGKSSPKVASGVCYGPYFEYNRHNRLMADFLSVCGMAVVDVDSSQDKQNKADAAVGVQLFNLFGLRGNVIYDPINNDVMWGIGVSITGVTRQLSK